MNRHRWQNWRYTGPDMRWGRDEDMKWALKALCDDPEPVRCLVCGEPLKGQVFVMRSNIDEYGTEPPRLTMTMLAEALEKIFEDHVSEKKFWNEVWGVVPPKRGSV